MRLFAHKGVDHATELESTTHATSSPLLMIALISIVTLGILLAIVYIARRKQVAQARIKKGDE
ncbi:MAG: hypothetical protein M3Q36_03830 [bacterium]|nr:hypothetical protein [bacterium]